MDALGLVGQLLDVMVAGVPPKPAGPPPDSWDRAFNRAAQSSVEAWIGRCAMTDTPDTTTMTGAEFMQLGRQPILQKWAEAFVGACKLPRMVLHMQVDPRWRPWSSWQNGCVTSPRVKVAEALRGETDSACPPTS